MPKHTSVASCFNHCSALHVSIYAQTRVFKAGHPGCRLTPLSLPFEAFIHRALWGGSDRSLVISQIGWIYFYYSFFLALRKEFFCVNRVGDTRNLLFSIRVMRLLCLPGYSRYDKDFSAVGGKQKMKEANDHEMSPMPMISKLYL